MLAVAPGLFRHLVAVPTAVTAMRVACHHHLALTNR